MDRAAPAFVDLQLQVPPEEMKDEDLVCFGKEIRELWRRFDAEISRRALVAIEKGGTMGMWEKYKM